MSESTAEAAPIGSEATPKPVWLSAIKLGHFRNYATLSLRLASSPVVLTGPNGGGKTNLLEAVSFLSPGRGLRRARIADVSQRSGDGSWAVAATIASAAGETEIGTGLTLSPDTPERQRIIRVNRTPAVNSQALLEHLRVVWLTPSMDGLFTGPAADRRRFLDRLVLAIDPRHGERVNAYERAMRERNRLLDGRRDEPKWLDAIEAQMAELGVAIAAARRECIGLLSRAVDGRYADGPFPAAILQSVGTIEAQLGGASATTVEDDARRTLAAGRGADRAAGRTLAGPHLSDLAVTHAPKEAPAGECSTGEQKALLIGIVLAHARLIARLRGEAPIVLLDEVAAHLDEARRLALFAILVDLRAQAWLTGTEPGPFAPLGASAQHFSVDHGTVAARP